MIELRAVSKYFPSNGVSALEKAGITLSPGEILALLGENGTGKSTLMHILSGYLAPSSGTILVDGKERRFSAPASALAAGIGMVRQHPGFIRGFRVWEDCILGAERVMPPHGNSGGGAKPVFVTRSLCGLFLNPGRLKKRVEELSNQWNFGLPLDQKTESLTVNQRQKAAVLALLLRDVKYFIFDEPTAVLTPAETETLFELFRRLRGEGRGIVLITHKLDEALDISNRVTVIRHGVTEELGNTNGLSVEVLKRSIFGIGGLASACPKETPPPVFSAASSAAPSVLVVKDLLLEPPGLPHIRNVNFSIAAGKILGIAGVRDSGLETLERAVSGSLRYAGKFEGSIALNGYEISGRGVRAFRNAGGAYLGADRLGNNLAPELPLRESLIIHAFRRARRGLPFFLNMFYLNSWCLKIMNKAGITRSASDRADSFSGGMLQRILLAREFAEEASLVVLAEAGSGLDEVSHAKLAEELKVKVGTGAAALLFSTDVDELISVADEIMVLRDGTFTAHFILRGNPGRDTILPAPDLKASINAAMTENAGQSND